MQDTGDREPGYGDGARAALPLLLPTLLLGAAFGLAAKASGFGSLAPIVMSVVVFSGSAQFASTGVLAAGGAVGAAVLAGAFANLRFVPMSLAALPALRGGPLRRLLEAQGVVDASIAIAAQGGRRVTRGMLFGATAPQAACWVGGTAIGSLSGVDADVEALGLDVVFPAFFLALLVMELRRPGLRPVAAGGAALALVLVPFLPPGIPVLAASAAALLGLRTARAQP